MNEAERRWTVRVIRFWCRVNALGASPRVRRLLREFSNRSDSELLSIYEGYLRSELRGERAA